MLAINQVAASLFRFIGGVARNMIVANVFAMLVMMAAIILNGFIIIRGNN
jgi:ABC-type multidrug transport system permease subunit